MKKRTFLLLATLLLTLWGKSFAQSVGINSDNSFPNTSAMLDVKSTSKIMTIKLKMRKTGAEWIIETNKIDWR